MARKKAGSTTYNSILFESPPNKLQGERAMVNEKYDMPLPPVTKSRETLEGGHEDLNKG